MRLDSAQLQQFYDDGYVVVRNAIPLPLIHAALRAVNHSLGYTGLPPDELPRMRSQSYCEDVRFTPALTDLANASPVWGMTESLFGGGNVLPFERAQVALRFPSDDGKPPADPHDIHGHLDGVGTGDNGVPLGSFIRNFTVLAVVYLQAVPEPWGGNFTVWPGSHHVYEAYFKQHPPGHSAESIPTLDFPRPPVQVTADAGDVVFTHHQLHHTAAPNHGHDVRYAAIFRAQHTDVKANDTDTMANMWREFPGVRAAMGAG